LNGVFGGADSVWLLGLCTHAPARWTGRTLRVEVEVWVAADATVTAADRIGQAVADKLAPVLPEMRSFTWTARGV
jgi:hypothetical protein